MIQIQLDLSYVKNSIRTSQYELRFAYNTNIDYFYFDVYTSSGDLIKLHNKVVTGYHYGLNIRFESSNNDSYANASNIANFSVVLDG